MDISCAPSDFSPSLCVLLTALPFPPPPVLTFESEGHQRNPRYFRPDDSWIVLEDRLHQDTSNTRVEPLQGVLSGPHAAPPFGASNLNLPCSAAGAQAAERRAAELLQTWGRGVVARRAAALRVQAWARGTVAARRFRRGRRAAVALQALQRGKAGRARAAERRAEAWRRSAHGQATERRAAELARKPKYKVIHHPDTGQVR